MALKVTQLFGHLNKIGLADQIHLRENDEIIFYHWNNSMTDLIPSLSIKRGLIERHYYPRSIVPLLYKATNTEIINDLTEEHQFVRDKRKQNDRD